MAEPIPLRAARLGLELEALQDEFQAIRSELEAGAEGPEILRRMVAYEEREESLEAEIRRLENDTVKKRRDPGRRIE